jgi:hypothetical protein
MRYSLLVPVVCIPAVLMVSPLCAQVQQSLAPTDQNQVQQSTAPTEEKMEVGQGVVCDTRQQIERFVALRGNGAETESALREVNEESHQTACGLAKVMFNAGARVGGMALQGRQLNIMQISVHAFSTGPVWTKVPATVRYTVTAEKGQVV